MSAPPALVPTVRAGTERIRTPRTSARAANLLDSGLGELLRLTTTRRAIDLALGIPEFPADPMVIEEACTELRAGRNTYADPAGDAELRRHVAGSLTTPADPDTEITITSGASEALCLALLCTVDPGDEVVILEPFYEHFRNAVALAGAVPRFVPLHRPDWRFDPTELAAAFGPRTRAVVLNTPHNPTGRVFGMDELCTVAEVSARWDATVICDEVYEGYTYDDHAHVSVADIPALRDRGIVIGSLSKGHALTGWRLGFLRAGARLTEVLRRAHMVTTAGSVAPLQAAVARSGILTARARNRVPALVPRREQALGMLRELGFAVPTVEGGCYLLADIRGVTDEGSDRFVARMLAEAGVLMAPGSLFTTDRATARDLVRVTFNRAPATLDAARRNLTEVLAPAVAGAR